MFDAIIKNRLIHGAIVWGHRCKHSTLINTLDKVQGLFLGDTTGSQRSTSLPSIIVLLDVRTLDKVMQAVATSACRRVRDGLPEALLRVLPDGLIFPGLTKADCDWIYIRYFFGKKYRFIISSRSHPLTKIGRSWFADCSEQETRVGAGAWKKGTYEEIAYSLNKHASVFQAAVRAITECAE